MLDERRLADARAIPGHISDLEGRWLATESFYKRVLEIGSFRGRSTAYMACGASRMVCCDHFAGQKTLREGQRALDMRAVEQDWHRNMRALGLSSAVSLLRMSSQQCLSHLRGCEEFDFVFVDGGHDYETVAHDTAFSRLLSAYGVIAFHDYSSSKVPEVRRAVDDWSRQQSFVRIEAGGSICAFQRIGT